MALHTKLNDDTEIEPNPLYSADRREGARAVAIAARRRASTRRRGTSSVRDELMLDGNPRSQPRPRSSPRGWSRKPSG